MLLGGTEVAFTVPEERITFASEQFWGRAVRASQTRQESGALLNFWTYFFRAKGSALSRRIALCPVPVSPASAQTFNALRHAETIVSNAGNEWSLTGGAQCRNCARDRDRRRRRGLKQVPREYRQILRLLSLL